MTIFYRHTHTFVRVFIWQMSAVSRSADRIDLPLHMQIRPYGATEAKMIPLFLNELLKLVWQPNTKAAL